MFGVRAARQFSTTRFGFIGRYSGDTQMRNNERLYGSERFRSLTRRTDLDPPKRFEPTRKQPEDVVI